MRSPADTDLARRDPALPGLATLLDRDAFVEALRPALPALRPGEARVTYVRYKPGRSCLVGYRMESAGEAVDVTATACRPDAQDKLAKARSHPGRVVLDDRAVVVSVFPDDASLPALARLADTDDRRTLLEKLLPNRPDLWDGSVVPLRYKPERRYVAQLTVDGEPQAALKVYSAAGYDAAQAAAKAFKSGGLFRRAHRLGRSARHCMLALEWLPGHLLTDALADPTFAPSGVEAVGAALAELHGQDRKALPIRGRADESATFPPLADWLAHVCPDLAVRAVRLAGLVAGRIAALAAEDRPLHGDFYAKQVLLGEDRVGLLDFDEAFRGDPAHDLGLFLAHLHRDAVRGTVPPDSVEPIRAALLDGYRRAGGLATAARVGLYTAAGLLRLAPHPFRNREPNWPLRTAAMLDRAEDALP